MKNSSKVKCKITNECVNEYRLRMNTGKCPETLQEFIQEQAFIASHLIEASHLIKDKCLLEIGVTTRKYGAVYVTE